MFKSVKRRSDQNKKLENEEVEITEVYDFDVDSDIEAEYIASLEETQHKLQHKSDNKTATIPDDQDVVTYDPIQSFSDDKELRNNLNYIVMMSMFYFELPPKFYERVNRSRTLINLLPQFTGKQRELAKQMFLDTDRDIEGNNESMRISRAWPMQIVALQKHLKKKEDGKER